MRISVSGCSDRSHFARITAWREHYAWIKPEGYAYFEARIPVVARDSSYTLDLVLTHAVTRDQQEAAVAALGLKCDVLWTMLDAIEHATERR